MRTKRCALAVLILLALLVPYRMQATAAQLGTPVPLALEIVDDALPKPGNTPVLAAQSDGVWRNYTKVSQVTALAADGLANNYCTSRA